MGIVMMLRVANRTGFDSGANGEHGGYLELPFALSATSCLCFNNRQRSRCGWARMVGQSPGADNLLPANKGERETR